MRKIADRAELLPLIAGKMIAGVDEAGRGPLAGDVFAAAVLMSPNVSLDNLRDSKKLSPKQRDNCYQQITEQALAWSVARSSAEEIDRLNILQASLLAMERAINDLLIKMSDGVIPDFILFDGQYVPRQIQNSPWFAKTWAIVGGDQHVAAISAASIIAKVSRDRYMQELDSLYPQYGFARHKGYGTAEHLSNIQKYGVCPVHRKSFAPITAMLEK